MNRANWLKAWEQLRASFWFVPGAMILAAIALAIALPEFEAGMEDPSNPGVLGRVFTPASAQAVLTTIATITMSVAGIVFSVTILTLSIASSQFGPRLLRTFMSRASTKIALGLFVSTAVLCLLLLVSIVDTPGQEFVPSRAVLASLVIGVLGLVYLVFFIHDVARSIQATEVVAVVADELDASIKRNLPPVDDASEDPEDQLAPSHGASVRAMESTHEGYVQGIDLPQLVELAKALDCTVYLRKVPGDFIGGGEPLADADVAESRVEKLEAGISRLIAVGGQRTPYQDVECAIAELVEVAVRALSPGVNDPFTALNCLDRLGAALGRLLEKPLPPRIHRDSDGTPRVVLAKRDHASALNAAFCQIRHFGRESIVVLSRIAEALERIAARCHTQHAREAVRSHAKMLRRVGDAHLESEVEREQLSELLDRVERALE